MKKKLLFLGFFSALLLVSCSKNDSTNQNKTSIQDQVSSLTQDQSLFVTDEGAMSSLNLNLTASKTRKSSFDHYNVTKLNDSTFLVNYGDSLVIDDLGIARQGSFSVVENTKLTWGHLTKYRKITFDHEYFVNGFKQTGSMTINNDLSLSAQIRSTSFDLRCENARGEWFSRKGNMDTEVLTPIFDFFNWEIKVSLNYTSQVSNSSDIYGIKTIEPMITRFGCSLLPSQGKIEIMNSQYPHEGDLIVYFGDGTCDNNAQIYNAAKTWEKDITLWKPIWSNYKNR